MLKIEDFFWLEIQNLKQLKTELLLVLSTNHKITLIFCMHNRTSPQQYLRFDYAT